MSNSYYSEELRDQKRSPLTSVTQKQIRRLKEEIYKGEEQMCSNKNKMDEYLRNKLETKSVSDRRKNEWIFDQPLMNIFEDLYTKCNKYRQQKIKYQEKFMNQENLQQKLQNQIRQKQRIQNQKKLYEQQNSYLLNQNDRLQKQLTALNNSKTSLELQKINLSEQVKKKQEEIKHHQQNNRKRQEQQNHLRSRFLKFYPQYTQLQSKMTKNRSLSNKLPQLKDVTKDLNSIQISEILLNQLQSYSQINKLLDTLGHQFLQQQQKISHCKAYKQLQQIKPKSNSSYVADFISDKTAQKIFMLIEGMIEQLSNSKQKEKQLDRKTDQLKQLYSQIEKVNKKLRVFESNQNEQIEVVVKTKQMHSLVLSLKNVTKCMRNQKKKLQKQLKQTKQNLQNIRNDYKQLQAKLQEQTKQYLRKISDKETQIAKLQNDIQDYKSQIKTSKQTIKNLDNKITKLQQQKNQHLYSIHQSTIIIKDKQNKLDDYNIKYNKLQSKVNTLLCQFNLNFNKVFETDQKQQINLTIQNYSQSIKHLWTLIDDRFIQTRYLSESQFFTDQHKQLKKYLISEIHSLMYKKIAKSKLLHQCDPNSGTMQWIKKRVYGKMNILMLLQMENGNMISVFSQEPYTEQIKKQGLGFLLSLTHKKKYKLKLRPDASILRYNPYFFSIGNDEIVIKANGILTSLFGTSHCYFDPQGDKITGLFGYQQLEQSRDMKYKKLEFHEIFFKMNE